MTKRLWILVLLVIVLGLGLSYYNFYFSKREPSPIPGEPSRSLAFVPADTLYFLGGRETLPIKPVFRHFKDYLSWMGESDWKEWAKAEALSKGSEASKLLLGLFIEYLNGIKNQDQFFSQLGFGPQIDFAVYSIEGLPVYRVYMQDPDAFQSFLRKVEKEYNIESKEASLGKIKYRRYSLSTPDNPIPMTVVIAIQDHFVVSTLEGGDPDEKFLSLALGLEKPKETLAASGVLDSIVKKYGYSPTFLGFLDHKKALSALTVKENKNARGLQKVLQGIKGDPEAENFFATLQTQACHDELMVIANDWPRTVFGFINMDFKQWTFEQQMVFESQNGDLMKDLMTLRGEIPEYLSKPNLDPIYSVALGLNWNAFIPFLEKRVVPLGALPFKCELLKQFQKELGPLDLTELKKISEQAKGLQGASLSLFDMQIPGISGTPSKDFSFDILVSVSASDPKGFLTRMAALVPDPYNKQLIQLAEEGKKVEVSLPLSADQMPILMIELKGRNILLYLGKQATEIAQSISEKSPNNKGLMEFGMDYERWFSSYFGPLQVSPDLKTGEFAKKALESMKNLKMKAAYGMDFLNEGIVLDYKIKGGR